MDVDVPAKEKVEMVIGTDPTNDASLPPLVYTPPTDDDVDILLSTLAGLAHNEGRAIEPFDLDVIHAVCDRLDQVYYWAIEEKHCATDPPMVHANTRLFTVVVQLLASWRPKVMAAVFRCLTELLQHKSRVGRYADVISYLCGAIVKFPAVEDVVEHATAAMVTMARVDPEFVLTSDGVSATLQAMQKLPRHLSVHRNGCSLFAALVAGKRPMDDDPPAALLLVHIGVAVEFICLAYQRQAQDSVVSSAVSFTLRTMASLEQNRTELVTHKHVLTTLKHLIEHHPFANRIVQDALTAVSDLVSELDKFQQRTMTHALKELMIRTTETETLAACIAVILRLLRAGGEEALPFMTEAQVPQVIAIALDHFGEQDEVLREVAMKALNEMVISKFRR